MSTPDASPPPTLPVTPAQKAVRLLVLVGFFALLGGVVYWKESSRARGGALALETPVSGALGDFSDVRPVPGRESSPMDRADVWRVELEAGQTVTIHTCANRDRGRSPSPVFVVQGPAAGAPSTHSQMSPRGSYEQVLVLTPTARGQHSVWVYKDRAWSPYSYRIEVLRGAHPEPSGDLCMGPFT